MHSSHFISILTLILCGFAVTVQAQQAPNTETVEEDGAWSSMIIEDGDTLFIFDLEPVQLTAARCFETFEDEARYQKYKRYATVVYPYAVQAIRIFEETDYVTRHMSKRKRKKHVKRLHKELKSEFQDKLKKLTKTQGRILVKMIERERDESMYDLIKHYRNGLTARYWHTASSFFEYDLKEKYQKGDDYIMDMILEDLDISYTLPLEANDDDELLPVD